MGRLERSNAKSIHSFCADLRAMGESPVWGWPASRRRTDLRESGPVAWRAQPMRRQSDPRIARCEMRNIWNSFGFTAGGRCAGVVRSTARHGLETVSYTHLTL